MGYKSLAWGICCVEDYKLWSTAAGTLWTSFRHDHKVSGGANIGELREWFQVREVGSFAMHRPGIQMVSPGWSVSQSLWRFGFSFSGTESLTPIPDWWVFPVHRFRCVTSQLCNRVRALLYTIPPLTCLPSHSKKSLVHSSGAPSLEVQTTIALHLQDALWLFSGYSLKIWCVDQIFLFLICPYFSKFHWMSIFFSLFGCTAWFAAIALLMHAHTHQTVSYCSAVRLDLCVEVKPFRLVIDSDISSSGCCLRSWK